MKTLFLFALVALATASIVPKPRELTSCDVCEDFINDLLQWLEDPDWQKSIEAVIDQLCLKLSQDQQATCKALVKLAFPKLMNFIDSEIEKICPAAGCSPQQRTSPNVCRIFTTINDKLEALPAATEKVCDQLPGEYANLCKYVVEKDMPQLVVAAEQMVKAYANKYNCDLKFLPAHMRLALAMKGDSAACTACRDAVDVLDYLLSSPLAEGSLQHLLDDLCAELDAPYNDACTKTVDDFLDVIVKFITDMTDHICDSTCQDGQKSVKSLHVCQSACNILTTAYNGMDGYITMAEGVCDRIPEKSLAEMCHMAFKVEKSKLIKIGQEIVAWLQKELNKVPLAACSQCSVAPTRKIALKEGDIGCEACEDALKIVDYLLKSPLVEGSLQDLLKEACSEIPDPTYSKNCLDTVDQFMDLIMDFAVDMVNHACDTVCPAPSKLKSFSGIICNLLRFAEDHTNVLLPEVAKICNEFPDNIASGCNNFFANHADIAQTLVESIIHLIGKLPLLKCEGV